jgi:hypothetical protein
MLSIDPVYAVSVHILPYEVDDVRLGFKALPLDISVDAVKVGRELLRHWIPKRLSNSNHCRLEGAPVEGYSKEHGTVGSETPYEEKLAPIRPLKNKTPS